MLSLRHLQRNLSKMFHLASADAISLNVYHLGRVFVMTIEPTNEHYTQKRRNKSILEAREKAKIAVPLRDCELCAGVKVGDICLNRRCPSNIVKNDTDTA
ncbi:hypothetical protein UFOVP1522_39 [uncultured Caudovirales phage]|uniref:Uncharacterized protein n=1 Tax=uncultured Caudovirales phage TaxID=2100421 RepID=A0A6J5PXI5_9CAUD|nr:hypothetical protein UFOVP989_48 [uncultured Caudovirales phage]CAB4181150.1 hypothetical protein UFOVP1075_18 [uncultured Caudovirales phage]CAB4198719.1 hypothetical protein UFOVP1312_10 [uncultured Caudovirales phage]CAB4210859.1 hypothetical protein UFOVP1426_48 [uncultured Caudovirales phage]CAB5227437.1 hypothetical protein UFOVP1522_39 [uncultured Caudovirales phage]